MKTRTKMILAILGLVMLAAGAWFWSFYRHPLAALAKGREKAIEKAGFEARSLEAPSGPMRVWEAGEGPMLVFLHGSGDRGAGWAAIAPALIDEYRVVLPDLPGHGASEPQSGDLKMESLVQGVETLIADLGPEPVILVGNSLGGWLASLQALEHPETVARLVLVNGSGLSLPEGTPSLLVTNREEARELLALLRDPGSPAVPDFVLDDLVRGIPGGPIARLSADLPGLGARLLDGRLGEIEVPVDLVWGASDRLLPLTYARRLETGLPAARLQTIPRCGHVPQVECPELLLAELEAVLAAESPSLPVEEPPLEDHEAANPEEEAA